MITNIITAFVLSSMNMFDIGDKNVTFFVEHEGKTDTNNNDQFYGYSTGKDSHYVINTFENLETCMEECAFDSNCLGLYNYKDIGGFKCNELSNLGHMQITSDNSYSYKKITYQNQQIMLI